MPNVLIEPDYPLQTVLAEIPTAKRIPNFTSRLLFFDNLILPAQKLNNTLLADADGIRNLFEGEQTKFLEKEGIGFSFCSPGSTDLRTACLTAKEEFEEGRFNPLQPRDRSILRKAEGADVFVSQRLLTHENSNITPTLTLEFVDGIPIPPRSWSPKGILDFKEKHISERKAFWDAIYLLAADLDFLQHPEPRTQLRADFLSALDEFTVKSGETFGTRIRDAISIDLTPLKTSTFLAGAVALENQSLIDFPLIVPILIGANGIVKFKLDLKPNNAPMSQTARGMSYLSRIRRS